MDNSGFLLQHCGLLIIVTIIYSTFKLLDSSQIRKNRAPSDLARIDTVVLTKSKESNDKPDVLAEHEMESKRTLETKINTGALETKKPMLKTITKEPTSNQTETTVKLSVRERILQLEKERETISAKKEYLKKIGAAAKPTISIAKVETIVNHTIEPEIIEDAISSQKDTVEKQPLHMPVKLDLPKDEPQAKEIQDIQIPEIVLSSPELSLMDSLSKTVSFDKDIKDTIHKEFEEKSDVDFSGTNESASDDEPEVLIEKTRTTISLDSYKPQLKNSLFDAISADLDLSFTEKKEDEYPQPKPEIESEPFTRKLTLSYFRKGIDLSFDDFDHLNSKRDSIDSTLTVSELAGSTLDLNEHSIDKSETVIEKSDSFDTIVEKERPISPEQEPRQRASNRDSAISVTVPKKEVEHKFVDLSMQNLAQLPFKTNLYHNVTHLRLDQNMLTTIPGHSMKHLRYLKILNLAHNLLEFLPPDIAMLNHLENLFLNNNRLVELPNEFKYLKRLKICSLGYNQLHSLDPSVFINMKSLVSLDLCYNQLSILPTSIGHLSYLQELNLLGNPFNPLFDPVVSPLNKSMKENYSNYQSSIWNNAEAQKQKKKMVHLSQPSQGYLERLQGFLMDIYDLQTQKPIVKQSPQPEFVPPEYILSRIQTQHYSQQLVKRERVVQEILETEKTYVEQLQIMYDLYYVPMVESKNFPSHLINLLFGNIENILKFHQRYLLIDLRTILPCLTKLSQSPGQTLGDFFSQISRNLIIYSAFMNNYDHSELVIQTFLGKPNPSYLQSWLCISDSLITSFQYHMEHAKASERHSQINLSSYLILPIQRLPRYKLLLTSLMERTPEDHPDYHHLKKALEDIHNMVEKCNELKRVWDQQQSTLSLLAKVKMTPKLATFFFKDISPSRRMLFYSQSFLVLKYLKKGFDREQLNPLVLVSNKKPQIRFQQFDIFTEYKFKPSKDQSSSKVARLVEQGGPISRYDVPFILANGDWKLAGCFPLNEHSKISATPIQVMNESRESIMRVYGPQGTRKYLRDALKSTYCRLGVHYVVHELLANKVQVEKEELHPEEMQPVDIYKTEGVWLIDDISHTVPSIGYVIKEPNTKGKLRMQELEPLLLNHKQDFIDIGIPNPKFLLPKFKSGTPIEIPNILKIDPKDYVDPDIIGRKVVVLGDCNNADEIKAIATDCTILIHEATNAFLAGDEGTRESVKETTISHGHSTPEMAGAFAKSINAKILILNHFSSRYRGDLSEESLKIMQEIRQLAVDEFNESVYCAYDYFCFDIP
ncbi:hypothetical protein HK103_001646, partial [Boothiomyces macroporosus]